MPEALLEVEAMADESIISFTISQEGSAGKGATPKTFSLRSGTGNLVRIGRAPGNDLVVHHRGASQYHAELRLLPDASGVHCLHIRDLSMNGTGLKTAANQKSPTQFRKKVDQPIQDGDILLVPMLLKAALADTDRTWLKVTVQEQGAAPPRPPGEAREDRAGATPASAAPQQAQPAARDGSGSDQDEDKAAEKSRMQFVELLLKTREVSAGTSYDEARRLLSNNSVWDAVDEATRRECFEIFVEHLGNHNNKSSKKKEKNKGKKEKRRHHEEEADAQKDGSEAGRGRRRKDGEKKGGSASPNRHRKSKRDKKGRERSRGRSAGGDASRSPSRQKKRRRGRSGSA